MVDMKMLAKLVIKKDSELKILYYSMIRDAIVGNLY